MYQDFVPELSPDFIFTNINQKDVIDYIYGYEIQLHEPILNLFRTGEPDNNPGAWFEYYKNRLVIVDFADPDTNRLDIIGLVGIYADISYVESMTFIYNKFIKGEELVLNKRFISNGSKPVRKDIIPINYSIGEFMERDKDFWKLRNITKSDLTKDKVYRCTYFNFYSTRLKKTIEIKIRPKELCYVFCHYTSRAVKIYRPEASNKKFKFCTNTIQDDIGLIQHINYDVNYIILTKGYKETRELINELYNAVYLMNEGVYPSKDALWFLSYFPTIYLLMDNDYTGKVYSNNLKKHILDLFPDRNVVILNCEFWNDLDVWIINSKSEALKYLSTNIIK